MIRRYNSSILLAQCELRCRCLAVRHPILAAPEKNVTIVDDASFNCPWSSHSAENPAAEAIFKDLEVSTRCLV
ncbi:unnamed protein product [Arctia plantaginis]|uniref:Uncharacterized protein n=1 Tax=Arctia plantaginis TaxID=874455 RepID=A0A8S0YVQ6_ARCPL|nr:unnamed protein product [Arctia plantaginis]